MGPPRATAMGGLAGRSPPDSRFGKPPRFWLDTNADRAFRESGSKLEFVVSRFLVPTNGEVSEETAPNYWRRQIQALIRHLPEHRGAEEERCEDQEREDQLNDPADEHDDDRATGIAVVEHSPDRDNHDDQ
jgi:hypothetical protein